jgi:hypothetical protein
MAEAKHRLHQGRDLYETVTKVAELRPGSALWINQSNQCAKGRCEMILGYARVSTEDQCFDGQLDALRAAGCQKIYREKISGTVRDRRALTAAIDTLGPGDQLIVTRLDRLARSTRDLLNLLAATRPETPRAHQS